MSLRFLAKRSRTPPGLAVRLLCGLGLIIFLAASGSFLYFHSHRNEGFGGLSGAKEPEESGDPVTVRVLVQETQKVVVMNLEEYLVGVVAAEMPASFSLEALKAQAVAARTYAAKRLLIPDPRVKKINQQADICTDHTINQAWISNEEMKKRWGKWNYAANQRKISRAVEETRGKVLVYQGQIIDPAYHASCGGKETEDSGEVWKFSVPYLQRVPCTGHADRHRKEVVSFSLKKLDRLLGTSLNTLPAGKLTTGGKGALQIIEKSNSGRIREVNIGGKNFTGAELRSKLELPSTRFGWQIKGGEVLFETNGYGHGVGMCQYGADDLAKQGKTFREILQHYYTGAELARIKAGKTWAE